MQVMVYGGGMETSTALELAPPVAHPATPGVDAWHRIAGAWLAAYSSPHTREAYRRDLTQFATWLEGVGIVSPLLAGRPAVDAYARHLEELELSPATRARKLSSVGSFYAYCGAEGLTDKNPAALVRRPKVSNESPRLGLSADEARRVIAAARTTTPAHRALVALCLGAGLRVSEALAVTPEALSTDGGHQVVKVTGKGGKVRTVPLSPQALGLLSDALEAGTTGEPVVRGPRGGRIDRHRALRMIEHLGKVAGIAHDLRPHDLRHAAATLALDAGAPVSKVQDLLGHSSPTTTMRYVHHRERLDNSAAYVLGLALAG